MDKENNLSQCHMQWKLSSLGHGQESTLVILLSDWVYGLIPYCGPGLRIDVWKREKSFQDEICRYLNSHAISTLSLEPTNPEGIPDDEEIISASQIHQVYSDIKQLTKESGHILTRTVLFSHGFGSRMMCELVAYGLKPAGYIIAGGIYSDVDSIITQKYLPFKNYGKLSQVNDNIPPVDIETSIILSSLGKILNASRKGRKKIKIKENDTILDIYLPEELFSEEKNPAMLYASLDAPSLIIQGSGDLDVPVSNAFFLETKLKQRISSVSRIVMLDKDHWFRDMPNYGDDRIRQRLTGECIQNPVDHRFLKNILIFIEDVLKLRKNKKKIVDLLPNPEEILYQADSVSGS